MAESEASGTSASGWQSRLGARIVAQLSLVPGSRVVLVGDDPGLLADLRQAVGPEGIIDALQLRANSGDAPGPVNGTPVSSADALGPYLQPRGPYDGAVWVAALGRFREDEAVTAFGAIYDVLKTKGRMAVAVAVAPRSTLMKTLAAPMAAMTGARYTTRQLHGMMERARFWDCGIVGRFGWPGVTLMQGEKFSANDEPDEIWTESQIVRALRVVSSPRGAH